MKVLIANTLLLLLLCSCLEESPEQTPAGETQFNQDTQTSFLQQEVICENEKDCPSYIARILVKQDTEMKTCSAFLVEPDTIMTSPDCLGPHINERTACSDSIKVYFPKSGQHEAVNYECKEIVRDTIYSPKKNDLFLIKIANTQRDIAIKSFRGIADAQTVDVWSVEQISQTVGLVKKKQCQTNYNSIIAPEYQSRLSPRISLADCNIGFGGQGSPVINSSGKVVAVINKTFDSNFIQKIEDNFFRFKGKKKPNSFSRALNFSCLRFLENIWNINTLECAYDELTPVNHSKNMDKVIWNYWHHSEKLNALVEAWSKRQKPFIYKWKPVIFGVPLFSHTNRDFSELLVTLTPDCMNRPLDWIEYFRRTVGGIPKIKEVLYSLPIMQMELFFNEKGQLESDLFAFDHSFLLTVPLYLKQIRDAQSSAIFVRKTIELEDFEYESIPSDNIEKSVATDKHLEVLSGYAPKNYKDEFCL